MKAKKMKVGIAGAGAIGMGYAAFLEKSGHTPCIWSPTGKRTNFLLEKKPLVVTGAIEGEFHPATCKNAELLAKNDVIILALPAYGQRAVLDGLIPHIDQRHCVIMSGHLSLAALYLSKKLAERGLSIPIAVWNTTALTAKAPTSFDQVRIGSMRSKIDIAVIPSNLTERGVSVCRALFGDPFNVVDDLLTITLGNINPIAHLAIALCNFTRIEQSEDWSQNTNTTSVVCNLLEELDRERLEIAAGIGKILPSLSDKMETSFGVAGKTLTELHEIEVERGLNPPGPKDINTRYVLEDVPFGLIPTLLLADLVDVNAPLHRSGVQMMNACYARDFAAENDFLPELNPVDVDSLMKLSVDGSYDPASSPVA